METGLNASLLVIVGPTASGKSDLGMKIAKKFDGEIICADSRTVYKNMDIGTAKPSKQDQIAIKHHLLDIVEPGQGFSAFDFKQQASVVIDDIRSRGKLPILVGGTGLYIDSIIFNFQFPPKADEKKQKRFLAMTIEELHTYCDKNNIILPENKLNKRYVISTILRKGMKLRRKRRIISNTFIVGITTENDILKQRIMQRTEYIFSQGVVEEAKQLGKIYGWDSEAMKGNIYRTIHRLVKNEINMSEAKNIANTLDWQLAKRQATWLKRNQFIHWVDLNKAEAFITEHIKVAKPVNQ